MTDRFSPPSISFLGLSGCPFVGSDVGGYSGRATGELYARWMQLGALSPFFRVHCMRDGGRQEPWAFGPEVERISREAIRERYALLPYLYSLMAEAAGSGAPPLRPLVWEFQDDPLTHAVDDELLLGPWLLAAPVLAPGVTAREVYLPAGRWIELATGAGHGGGRRVRVDAPLGTCPAFLREGAIVPRCEPLEWSDQRPPGRLELDCFPGASGTAFTLYEDDGETRAHERGAFSRVTYRLSRAGDRVALRADAREGTFAPAARKLEVRLREVAAPAAVRIDGVELLELAPGSAGSEGWRVDPAGRSVCVVCEDRVPVEIVVEERVESGQPNPNASA
jgi:alpha-glucosidase